MKSLSLILLCILSTSAFSQSKSIVNSQAAPFIDRHFNSGYVTPNRHSPPNSQGVPIPLPGTVSIGLEGMYQQQFSNRGLHNIIVDPDHPNNLHAAIQFAQNVTEADTVAGKGFLPQLRVYYLFSTNDGKTWSTPKAIDTARTSNHEMILMKRGSEYVPVIAAIRDYPDSNTPYYCSLYIEQGSAGTGNFKEFRTDRKTFLDSLRNLDYPSIALSSDGTKIFMTAGIDNANSTNPGYVQFGTFTLGEDGKTATWGGWKPGPSAGQSDIQNPLGFAYSYSTSVRVSPSGKIGVLWVNRDYGTPDLSTYLSESTDGGATWLPTPKSVLTPLETQQQVQGNSDPYFFVAFNTDLWYVGEHAQCAMSGYYYNRDTGKVKPGFYIPQSGSLLFWNDTMTNPVLVLSKENDTPLGLSLLDPTFLTAWVNTAGSPEPQGLANLEYPTVARSSDPKVFSIYFSAWQDGDVEDVTDLGENPDPTFTSLPYFGIWKTTTLDGGVTFSEAEMVHGNDLNNPDAQLYDYRVVETAPWNPSIGGNTADHILFNVDTLAGMMPFGGYPGFDDVTWQFEERVLSGVASLSNSLDVTVINYPNPFSAKTSLPFTLGEASLVSLVVSDAFGREIAHTNYGILSVGEQHIDFIAGKLRSGSYPYVLNIGDKVSRGIFKVLK